MSVSTPIKILAINASEREDGNNTLVLSHAAELLAKRGVELEVVRLWDLKMTPCGPCGDCNFREIPCAVDDDVAGVVEKMAAADGIIYATPIHGYVAAPLMPAFIERSGTGYLRFDRRLTNKVAGVIVTGRRYGHVETYANLIVNALLNRMIVAGYGFPSVLYGNAKGEVLQDEEGMEMVNRMLDRMVDLIVLLQEHRTLTGRDGLQMEVPSERARV